MSDLSRKTRQTKELTYMKWMMKQGISMNALPFSEIYDRVRTRFRILSIARLRVSVLRSKAGAQAAVREKESFTIIDSTGEALNSAKIGAGRAERPLEAVN